MSVEISSDILVVREKCRWKFQRHFSCERKMSVEIGKLIQQFGEQREVLFKERFHSPSSFLPDPDMSF